MPRGPATRRLKEYGDGGTEFRVSIQDHVTVRASFRKSLAQLDGCTNWPCWLKLGRQGGKFIGYSSKDGTTWSKIEADVAGVGRPLDVGVFARRSSARFMDFQAVKEP